MSIPRLDMMSYQVIFSATMLALVAVTLKHGRAPDLSKIAACVVWAAACPCRVIGALARFGQVLVEPDISARARAKALIVGDVGLKFLAAHFTKRLDLAKTGTFPVVVVKRGTGTTAKLALVGGLTLELFSAMLTDVVHGIQCKRYEITCQTG